MKYRITVKTGDVEDAGTDANVFITLVGERGVSREMLLDSRGDNFERGQVDVFTKSMDDIGEIKEIKIRHDNDGKKPGWFLDSITVARIRKFNYTNWIAKDEGDRALAKVLT